MQRRPQHENGSMFLTAGVFSLMLCYAVSITMLGPMMPDLIADYDLSLAGGGLFMSLQSAGGILSILVAAGGADRVHKTRLLALLFSLYAAGLHLISTAPLYPLLLASFALVGASTSVLDAISTAFIADLHPHRRDIRLSQLHTFFAIGALLGPLLTRTLLDLGGTWQDVYSTLGYVCLLVLGLFLLSTRSPHPAAPAEEVTQSGPLQVLAIVTSSRMWSLCVIAFLYLSQSGLVVWLPMYVETHLHSSPLLGSISVSAMWVGIIIGRWGYGFLTPYIDVPTTLRWGALLGGISLITGFTLQSPGLLVLTVGLKGALTGPVLPLVLHLACSRFPTNSGAVSCLIFLSGFLGTMIFPWLLGFAGELLGLHISIYAAAVAIVAISSLTGLLSHADANAAESG